MKKFIYLFGIAILFLLGCGPKQGITTEYYPNGKMESWGFYKDGKLEGTKIEYRQDGKVFKIFYYTTDYEDSSFYYNYFGDTTRVYRMNPTFKEINYLHGKLFSIKMQFLDKIKGDTTGLRYYFKKNAVYKELDTESLTDSGLVLRLYKNDTLRRVVIYYKGENRMKKIYYMEEGSIVQERVWSPGARIPQVSDDEQTTNKLIEEVKEKKKSY